MAAPTPQPPSPSPATTANSTFTEPGILGPFGTIVIRNPQKAHPGALVYFVNRAISSYQNGNERGEELCNSFGADFCDWEVSTLDRVDDVTLRKLRDTLYDRGVYTNRDNNESVADQMKQLLADPYVPWPNDDNKTAVPTYVNSSSSSSSSSSIQRQQTYAWGQASEVPIDQPD